MRLIAFHGKKQCGKNTAADALIADGWTHLSFADPLRHLLIAQNPIVHTDSQGRVFRWGDVYEDEGYEVVKAIPEGRRLMKFLATEGIRAIDPDFFVRYAESRMSADPSKNYVISDCRFENEA